MNGVDGVDEVDEARLRVCGQIDRERKLDVLSYGEYCGVRMTKDVGISIRDVDADEL